MDFLFYSLLCLGFIAALTAVLYSRSWVSAGLVVTLFSLALLTVHQSMGWPVPQLPPSGSTVVWIHEGNVWALPEGSNVPRAYAISPEQTEEMRREFFGREGHSPMIFHDKDGEDGFALLPVTPMEGKE